LLLHGNIPQPLHTVTPRSILGQDWWDKERREAYAENNFCCWACGVHKTQANYHQWLEGHEMYSIDWKKGVSVYTGACALCHSCHNYVHSGRLRMLADKGEITKAKYRDIMRHGNAIVGERGPLAPRGVQ
jgi:hypothetical protein